MRVLALTIALLAAVSCSGSDEGPTGEAGEQLAETGLRPDEAPSGFELDEDVSGPMASLKDVLPPESAAPHLPDLAKEARRSFVAGYDAIYRGSGGSEVTSAAIRFTDTTQASTFLEYLRLIQTAEVTVGSSRADVEELDAPSVGEAGYGWHRSAPGGETSGCSWRRGDLVLSITLSGPLGRASAEQALELARKVDARLA